LNAVKEHLPKKVAAFQVVRRIATGGTSDVLLARTPASEGLPREVVLKLLLPHLRNDPQFERMFEREAAAYARLSHPAIVRLYDFFGDEGQLVMVLEYIDGLPLNRLRAMLKQRGEELDDRAALFLGSRVVAALAAAHAARDPLTGAFAPVIHRDVNPSNVLLPWDGHAKLADFGIAKVTGLQGDTMAGLVKGTFGYMAPEQVRGENVTVRTDVYAAALLLWELLSRRRAVTRQSGNFSDQDVLQAMAKPQLPSLDVLRPTLPRALREAIRVGLEPAPEKRLITADELWTTIRSTINLEDGRLALADALSRVRSMSEEEAAMSQVRPPSASLADSATRPNDVYEEGISDVTTENPAANAMPSLAPMLEPSIPPPAPRSMSPMPRPRPGTELSSGIVRSAGGLRPSNAPGEMGTAPTQFAVPAPSISPAAAALGATPTQPPRASPSQPMAAVRVGTPSPTAGPPRASTTPSPQAPVADGNAAAARSRFAGGTLALDGGPAKDAVASALAAMKAAAQESSAAAARASSIPDAPVSGAVPTESRGESFVSAPTGLDPFGGAAARPTYESVPDPFGAGSGAGPDPFAPSPSAPGPGMVGTLPPMGPPGGEIASAEPPPASAAVPPKAAPKKSPSVAMLAAIFAGSFVAVGGIVWGIHVATRAETPSEAPAASAAPLTAAPVASAVAAPPASAASADGAKPTGTKELPKWTPPAANEPEAAKGKAVAAAKPAEAVPEKPATDAPPKPAVDRQSGLVFPPAAAKGHRVFIDGKVAGEGVGPYKVSCGPHQLKVGSGGKVHAVIVPCGGEAHVH
jgi:serine/threonine protein kinase